MDPKSYRTYSNFLKSLSFKLTRFYYKKLDKNFVVYNKQKGSAVIKKLLESEGIEKDDEEKITKLVKFQGQQKLRAFLDEHDLWPALQNSLKEMLF